MKKFKSVLNMTCKIILFLFFVNVILGFFRKPDSKISNFERDYFGLISETSSKYGIPYQIVYAQAALESNYGTSKAAIEKCNLFGISPGGKIATYDSVRECFDTYGRLISTRYSKCLEINNLNDVIGK